MSLGRDLLCKGATTDQETQPPAQLQAGPNPEMSPIKGLHDAFTGYFVPESLSFYPRSTFLKSVWPKRGSWMCPFQKGRKKMAGTA